MSTWIVAKNRQSEWATIEHGRRLELAAAKKAGKPQTAIATLTSRHAIAVRKLHEATVAANPRRHPDDICALAYIVLHHKDSRCWIYDSPTGGFSGTGLETQAKGEKPLCAMTGQRVWITKDLLTGAIRLLDKGKRVYEITCILNGFHHGRNHPLGQALDVVVIGGGGGGELNTAEIGYFVDAPGAQHYFDEDEMHDHLWTGAIGP